MVKRIYVERKTGYDIEAQNLLQDIKNFLLIKNLTNVRYINRYDVQGITDEILETAKYSIFSAQLTDVVSEDIVIDGKFFAAEYLPGQYDQRADLFTECLKLLTPNPKVKTARIYMFYGNISDDDFAKIKNYIINAVESRETSLSLPETLEEKFATPSPVADVEDFINLNDNDIPDFIKSYSLAMDVADVKLTRDYFGNTEKRNPTIAELRLLDTYWSDHCRHTTFLTVIEDVKIAEPYIQETYNDYLAKRKEVYGERHKNISLMDLATLGAKYLKMTGQLKNVDESEEVNACSVKIKVDVDGKDEDWLFYFKNETHNHPTEIEPFGGAATCLGGGIRDPLSGRSCVHQAMRVTGCADPRTPFSETIPGKLPQRKITQTAANGYSSYGNQIGGAAGQVTEIYHPDYVAKRMEMGALVGAAPVYNVVRETPIPGDVVILLGGRTGRDGIGAASGSSKSHTSESLTTSGAEVQKGDPIEERKIVRLFRDPKVTRLIKRCNDFGAGGVSVCIGELADGILVHLDNVPTKYDGMDGTEIALSES
ncbi:MAG: AIR synthase-related protein, partial [Oscillospiraceae bacterium]|nr:AIR synthase-related protein [Oscillospiraceae bacterium]